MADYDLGPPVDEKTLGNHEIRHHAPVLRIMRAAIPPKFPRTPKIACKTAEKYAKEKRKTVSGEDILSAMISLGFENYAEALKIYLNKYREAATKKTPAKQKLDEGPAAAPEDADTASDEESEAPDPIFSQQHYLMGLGNAGGRVDLDDLAGGGL